MKPRVFITHAEHPSVPGASLKVFASKAGADGEATRLVNIIRRDSLEKCPSIPEATPESWGKVAQTLAEHHGDDDCWVEVTEHEVHP